MSTYRDDRAALTERIATLEAELAELEPELEAAEVEAAELEAEEEQLAQELARRAAPRPGKTRFDRALESVVYTPLASALGGGMGLAAGFLVIGLPTFLFTDDPGNWLVVVVGLAALAGAIAAGVHTLRSVWRAD